MPNKMLDRWGQKKEYVPRKAEPEMSKKAAPAGQDRKIEDEDKKKSPYLNPPSMVVRG